MSRRVMPNDWGKAIIRARYETIGIALLNHDKVSYLNG